MNYNLFEVIYYKMLPKPEFFKTKISAKDEEQAKKKFKQFYPTFTLWNEPNPV